MVNVHVFHNDKKDFLTLQNKIKDFHFNIDLVLKTEEMERSKAVPIKEERKHHILVPSLNFEITEENTEPFFNIIITECISQTQYKTQKKEWIWKILMQNKIECFILIVLQKETKNKYLIQKITSDLSVFNNLKKVIDFEEGVLNELFKECFISVLKVKTKEYCKRANKFDYTNYNGFLDFLKEKDSLAHFFQSLSLWSLSCSIYIELEKIFLFFFSEKDKLLFLFNPKQSPILQDKITCSSEIKTYLFQKIHFSLLKTKEYSILFKRLRKEIENLLLNQQDSLAQWTVSITMDIIDNIEDWSLIDRNGLIQFINLSILIQWLIKKFNVKSIEDFYIYFGLLSLKAAKIVKLKRIELGIKIGIVDRYLSYSKYKQAISVLISIPHDHDPNIPSSILEIIHQKKIFCYKKIKCWKKYLDSVIHSRKIKDKKTFLLACSLSSVKEYETNSFFSFFKNQKELIVSSTFSKWFEKITIKFLDQHEKEIEMFFVCKKKKDFKLTQWNMEDKDGIRGMKPGEYKILFVSCSIGNILFVSKVTENLIFEVEYSKNVPEIYLSLPFLIENQNKSVVLNISVQKLLLFKIEDFEIQEKPKEYTKNEEWHKKKTKEPIKFEVMLKNTKTSFDLTIQYENEKCFYYLIVDYPQTKLKTNYKYTQGGLLVNVTFNIEKAYLFNIELESVLFKEKKTKEVFFLLETNSFFIIPWGKTGGLFTLKFNVSLKDKRHCFYFKEESPQLKELFIVKVQEDHNLIYSEKGCLKLSLKKKQFDLNKMDWSFSSFENQTFSFKESNDFILNSFSFQENHVYVYLTPTRKGSLLLPVLIFKEKNSFVHYLNPIINVN